MSGKLLTVAAVLCHFGADIEGHGAEGGRRVSSELSILFGPGLNRRIVTPARYLFVQAVDQNGRNFTESAGNDIFQEQIVLEHEGRQSVLKSQLNDRGDGTYQIFFFYGIQPDRLVIHVKGKDGVFVGGKGPRVVKKAEVEQCYCPTPDAEDWAGHYGCRAEEPQIKRDFENFPRISKDAVASTLAQLQKNEHNCFVHYITRDNRLYGKAYGMWQGFKQYIDEMLLSLMRRVVVPDTEFIFNLGDWPLGNGTQRGLPIMSFCGSASSTDIVVPTYKLFLATVFGKDLENVRDVDARAFSVGGGWARKWDKMVWRGRDSNPLRVKFVDEIAASYPHLIDANISKNQMNYYPSELDRLNDKLLQAGKKVERISFFNFWKYKYLLSIDGTVAAYRIPALLAGDSALFLPASPWYEHFYSQLEPWVHFVPVKEDLGDVVQQLLWARKHDAAVKNISRNARLFARDHLTAEQVYCYYFKVLHTYNESMDYVVAVPGNYQESRQPEPPAHLKCKCSRKRKRLLKDSSPQPHSPQSPDLATSSTSTSHPLPPPPRDPSSLDSTPSADPEINEEWVGPVFRSPGAVAEL